MVDTVRNPVQVFTSTKRRLKECLANFSTTIIRSFVVRYEGQIQKGQRVLAKAIGSTMPDGCGKTQYFGDGGVIKK